MAALQHNQIPDNTHYHYNQRQETQNLPLKIQMAILQVHLKTHGLFAFLSQFLVREFSLIINPFFL